MKTNGRVYRFNEQLEYANAIEHEAAWARLYKEIWPAARMVIRHDGAGQIQRLGIDREIVLPDNRRFYIDEKVRRDSDGHDILLEDWSVFYGNRDQRNKIGWALDPGKLCDFIAYACPAFQLCYLLPFELLRHAFRMHRSSWEKYRVRDTENEGYVTRNVAVPCSVLRDAMFKPRGFDAGNTHLPDGVLNGLQWEFSWPPVTEADIPWKGRS